MSMYSLTSRLLTVLALLASPLFSQLGPMPDLVADSLQVPVTADSTIDRSGLTVVDNRAVTDRVVGVRQIKKWRYIPVDQYFVLDKPLTTSAVGVPGGHHPDTGCGTPGAVARRPHLVLQGLAAERFHPAA